MLSVQFGAVHIYTACDILRSKKQNHITSAKRLGDKALLTEHRFVCPFCGKETPAYMHYWNYLYWGASPKKNYETITEWANIQPSLLGESCDELQIQECEVFTGTRVCPECGHLSCESHKYRELNVSYGENKVYVKRAIKTLSELLSIKWLDGASGVEFPLCEQIAFDFDSGVTCLEVLSNREKICSTVFTDSETDFQNDVLIDLLCKNNVLKRTIRKTFEEVTGCKMPFAVKKLDFDKFVNFVRFVGFPKNFYDEIPFWKGSKVVDESFRDIIRELRNPVSAMKLLEKSSIPFCKSVKRLFAKKSGLFFYMNECEFFYDLFKDVNLFCTFLNNDFIFHLLSTIHYYEYPLKTFFRDYARVLGKSRLTGKSFCSERIIGYGTYYASLSEYVRKKEQKVWIEGVDFLDDFKYLSYRENNISVSMPFVSDDMKDSVLGKYRFCYLRTKRDCVIAGEKLKNCLVNWSAYSNPVVVVSKGDRMLAAIEIMDGELLQANGAENKDIDSDSRLFYAIAKWCNKNNIKFDPENISGPFLR